MANKTDVLICPKHGEYFSDAPDSPCPGCEDMTCTECDDPECPGIEVCPRCGAECHNDVTIADHNRCYDCFKAWQHGEEGDLEMDLALADWLGLAAPPEEED